MIYLIKKITIFVHKKILINMSYLKIVMEKLQLQILQQDLSQQHMKFVFVLNHRMILFFSLDIGMFKRRCT
jgi:hypothetical protein